MNKKYPNLPYDETQEKIYSRWKSMKRRCKNKNRNWYKNGIKVCEEWLNFENFYWWAINNGFDKNKNQFEQSLDRINNTDDYKPNNCRWTTIKNQNRNTCKTKYITYKNKTLCITAWAEYLGLNVKTLRSRLDNQWSIEKAFNTPLKISSVELEQ